MSALNFLKEAGFERKFHDPFLTPSSDFLPETFKDALDLCLFLYLINPQYAMATKRVIGHFVTDIDFKNGVGDKAEKDKLKSFLIDTLNILNFLMEVGDEWGVYGNAFIRVHFPFDRYLIDPDGKRDISLDQFADHDVKYNSKDLTYTAPDLKNPGKTKVYSFRDQKSKDASRISLRKLNPRDVTLDHSIISGRSRVIYSFDKKMLADIKSGVIHQVNETPISMLRAISKDMDFRFNEGHIYHLKAPVVSGVSSAGWGLPPTIQNYSNIHNLQVYRKIDEVVGRDYMLPFRIFTPSLTSGMNDVAVRTLLGKWGSHIKGVISNRRKDPYSMHSLPFPVNYQEFGAEGKSLTPRDIMEHQTKVMLDGMGYPAELFNGSLQVMQVPTTMRLFENTFGFIYQGFNSLTKWISASVQTYMNKPVIEPSLQRPRMADNLEQQNLYLQLASGGEISRAKGYRGFGITDPVAEIRQRIDEDLEIEKMRTQKQEEFQREMSVGSMDQIIGASMDAAAQEQAMAQEQQGGATPLDVASQAQEIAMQWLQIPNVGERRKQMESVKASNPTLYAAAKQAMEEMRSSAASQGRAQAGQQ